MAATYSICFHAFWMVRLVESTFPREKSGWNLVKVHLLLHLTEAIQGGGLPREYSAAVYENAHIRTCKRPYQRSNHWDVGRVIAQHNTNATLLTRLPTNLEGDRKYNTAMRRAIAGGLPQLCRQRSRMHSAIKDREQSPLDLYATYDAAIPGGIGPYSYLMRLYGYVSFPAWVHTALALPARETDYGLIRPHYVHTSVSHHGAPAFSFIEYENGSGETVHGRVHLLLTLMLNIEDAHPAGEAFAFVRHWYPSQVDECTGCTRMQPSDDELSYDIVPVGWPMPRGVALRPPQNPQSLTAVDPFVLEFLSPPLPSVLGVVGEMGGEVEECGELEWGGMA
ncbi:unnamed protein product [Closterium sp. NIES-64]|nr:unnamed protein product [Closterium sp. NIES-64]